MNLLLSFDLYIYIYKVDSPYLDQTNLIINQLELTGHMVLFNLVDLYVYNEG